MKKQYDTVDEYIADLKAEIAKTENCAIHHYNLGVALLSKRDFVGAEEGFLNAVRQSPRLAEAYVQLGGICQQRGDLDGCLRYNEEAANCRAQFPVPWSNIGYVHLERGEPTKAIVALKKAIKWDPNFVQAMATLGAAYFMNGDIEDCITISTEAIKKAPQFAPAYNNLALAWLEKGDLEKAKTFAKEAQQNGFDLNPDFAKELGFA